MLELAYWLERLPEAEGLSVTIDGREMIGRFLKSTTANAMSMGLMGETIDKGVMYQIQIYAEYKIESEDLI